MRPDVSVCLSQKGEIINVGSSIRNLPYIFFRSHIPYSTPLLEAYHDPDVNYRSFSNKKLRWSSLAATLFVSRKRKIVRK